MTSIPNRSLVRRLLLGFTVVLLGVWFGIVSWDLAEMKPIQKKDMQRELRGTAYRVLAVVHPISDHPEEIPAIVKRMEALHQIFFVHSWARRAPLLQTQVWKNGKLLYASNNLNVPPTIASLSPENQPIKDGWISSIAVDPQTGITVRMATEFISQWAVIGFTSIGYYFNPLLFSLPLLLLPAWLIIRVGLRPLNTIVSEIESRSGSDLSPLAQSPYVELSPVIGSVNGLMEMLTDRLEREQEFLIDAAHEIKTPLAIIQINSEALIDTVSPHLIREAIDGLRHGVERATHTMGQLLTLSRSDSDPRAGDAQATDLIMLLRDRVALAMQIAAPRKIEIAMQVPESCILPLHRESMASLIDNLINNAMKYSPDNSRIAVSVTVDARSVRLTVIDQGPGIAPELRRKVFERFYRLPDQDIAGSGLGLAIAARAATRNFGTIDLETGTGGIGLAAIVSFSIGAGSETNGTRGAPASRNRQRFSPLQAWRQFREEKLKSLRNKSLFRRMLMGFMAVVAGMWLGYLGWSVYDAKTVKVLSMQGDLKRSAQRMLVIMDALAERPREIPPVVKKMEKLHYAFYEERGWYSPPLQTQIWKGNTLFYVSTDPRLPPTPRSVGPYQQPIEEGWISCIETDPKTGVTVRMATVLVADWFWSSASIGYFLKPLLICFPLLALMAWLIIRLGLRPLYNIVAEIKDRSASNLSALAPSPYAELSPLVNSVNRLMERLTQRLEREQEFLVDAAQELQSPLATIRSNLALLLNDTHHPLPLEQAAHGLRHGVTRAAHTVHQLLALSRSGSDRDKGDFLQMDLVELLRDRLALSMQAAIPRGIRIALYSPENCMLPMHRESMVSLIDNLISNAVKCSPEKSKISVSVNILAQCVQLIVVDKGMGIAPEFRNKVFERFYRLPGHDEEGSGLGLSIAERAAVRNFGTIRLKTGRNGIGLAVIVEFQLETRLS
jgi:signal transduction histidine kinase